MRRSPFSSRIWSGSGRRFALCEVAAALFLALLLAGCPRHPEGGADGGGPARAHEATAPGPGLRVSLPTGWLATAEGNDALVIGPQGRAVMRISRSQLSRVPSLLELKSTFSSEMSGVTSETLDAEENEDRVLWRARLSSSKAGGRTWTVALGAKRVGDSVFLCATQPGASDAEVKAAAESCQRLGQ